MNPFLGNTQRDNYLTIVCIRAPTPFHRVSDDLKAVNHVAIVTNPTMATPNLEH